MITRDSIPSLLIGFGGGTAVGGAFFAVTFVLTFEFVLIRALQKGYFRSR
jgi:hypothetical protein